MNHLSAKSLLAAVATVALLGTAAPAAVAGPPADKPSPGAKADRDAARDAAKSERNAAKTSKAEARVERVLSRIADSRKLERLDDATETLVAANIQADIDADGADGLRPSTYRQVINQLAFAERLLVAAAADTDATTAVEATVAKLVTFNAATEKADLRETKRELQVVAALLEDETEAPEEPAAEDGTQVQEPAPAEETAPPVEETAPDA